MSRRHAERELGIFHKFMEISGLAINRSSVCKLDKPAPDIFCRTTSKEVIGFELVELLDRTFANHMSRQRDGGKLLACLHENLSSQKRARFDALYYDADLQFGFQDYATMESLKQRLPLAFDDLLAKPEHFQGEIPTFDDKKLAKALKFVIVNRGVVGPLFNVENYMRIGDPTLDTLTSKFKKTYQVDYSIELLAYIDRNLMFCDNVWKPGVEQLLQRSRGFGQFRKVWIVDVHKKVVHFEVMAT